MTHQIDSGGREWYCRRAQLKVAAEFDLHVGDGEKDIQTVNCFAIFRDMVVNTL
jgi:hypothetical protein